MNPGGKADAHGTGGHLRATEKLAVTVEGATITVDDPLAVVLKGKKLTWIVSGAEAGHEVEIDFHVGEGAKGPFARNADAKNPVRGRYRLANEKYATGPADRVGLWKYQVVVYDGKGNEVALLDPVIIIKDGE